MRPTGYKEDGYAMTGLTLVVNQLKVEAMEEFVMRITARSDTVQVGRVSANLKVHACG